MISDDGVFAPETHHCKSGIPSSVILYFKVDAID